MPSLKHDCGPNKQQFLSDIEWWALTHHSISPKKNFIFTVCVGISRQYNNKPTINYDTLIIFIIIFLNSIHAFWYIASPHSSIFFCSSSLLVRHYFWVSNKKKNNSNSSFFVWWKERNKECECGMWSPTVPTIEPHLKKNFVNDVVNIKIIVWWSSLRVICTLVSSSWPALVSALSCGWNDEA